jgi:tripartite-type tricarboxylate transporter receptor subunit TctC
MPTVPTFVESGVQAFASLQRQGMLAPAGTPKEVVALLNREINKALEALDLKERFVTLTFDPTPGSPEEFRKFLLTEDVRWREVQKRVNVRLD